MPGWSDSERSLVAAVRAGDPAAWNEMISRFEGRLLAFVEGRVGRRSVGEDVVQETFLGFLNSLPNYDDNRSLEGYLFSIAAHKLTDHLRREGRRPTVSLTGADSSDDREVPHRGRAVSSALRSEERRDLEEAALGAAMRDELARCQKSGQWQKIECLELLFVRGLPNKEAAARIGVSEQVIANFKFDFLDRLRNLLRKQELSEDVFPELRAGKD